VEDLGESVEQDESLQLEKPKVSESDGRDGGDGREER
jgi:hypothetical protein